MSEVQDGKVMMPVKGCPFCNSKKVSLSGNDAGIFFMRCDNSRCQAVGPHCTTQKAAVMRWQNGSWGRNVATIYIDKGK